MSMYAHVHSREDKAFHTFVGLHSEHRSEYLVSVVVELVLHLVFIGAILCGIAFLASAYVHSLMHLISVWALSEHHSAQSTEHE